MALFDYLATASSLLYSVAALRILGGLGAALVPGRRYSLHLGLMFNMLLLITLSFWTFWSLRDVIWTFRGFALALQVPGLLYYCGAVLVPENPETVLSWRDHYFSIRRRWYAGLALWGVAAAVSASVNLGMPMQHPARAVHLVALVLGIVGMVSSHQRVNAVVVVLIGTMLVMGAINPELDADWLTQP